MKTQTAIPDYCLNSRGFEERVQRWEGRVEGLGGEVERATDCTALFTREAVGLAT